MSEEAAFATAEYFLHPKQVIFLVIKLSSSMVG